jgi:Family of unknown function (DUF6928)
VGLRTAIVAFGDLDLVHELRSAPVLNRSATDDLVRRLFPDRTVVEAGDALLIDGLDPPGDMVYAGSFPGVDVVCSWQLVGDRPSAALPVVGSLEPGSTVPPRESDADRGTPRHRVMLHAMDAGAQWCAFGVWEGGRLVRSVSLARDRGVVEDVGERMPFEQPYWSGDHPAGDGSPLPFRPAEFGVEALKALFGFELDGVRNNDDVDPEVIPLVGYRLG